MAPSRLVHLHAALSEAAPLIHKLAESWTQSCGHAINRLTVLHNRENQLGTTFLHCRDEAITFTADANGDISGRFPSAVILAFWFVPKWPDQAVSFGSGISSFQPQRSQPITLGVIENLTSSSPH
jgi:hypothetical protein